MLGEAGGASLVDWLLFEHPSKAESTAITQYQLTLDPTVLQHLFSTDRPLAQLVEAVLNQVLQAQVSEQVQAERYERTNERQGYRNGSETVWELGKEDLLCARG